MISMKNERGSRQVNGLCGGQGITTFHPLFERGVLPRNVSSATLEPGASCGEHLHDKDEEIYFVLEGELVILEDGKEYIMHAGDCEYCQLGHTHGAINRTDTPATFLAIALP